MGRVIARIALFVMLLCASHAFAQDAGPRDGGPSEALLARFRARVQKNREARLAALRARMENVDAGAPDAEIDAAIDDVAPAQAIDAGIDAANDAGIDAAGDAGLDAPIDVALDAPIDVALDAPVDAPIDAVVDAPRDGASPRDAAPLEHDAAIGLPSLADAAPTIDATREVTTHATVELRDLLPRDSLPDWHFIHASPLLHLLFLLLAFVASAIVARARETLPVTGLLPTTVALGHALIRLVAFALVLAFLGRMLPTEMRPAIPIALVGAAIAVGWSLRDVLPDVAAAAVLSFERRVTPGMWISGEGFSGIVERRSLRATWLRDGHGRRLAVPNRVLLSAPLASQISTGPVHDVVLRMDLALPAQLVRRAIHDAVLSSPWVRSETPPSIRRDGADPTLWHVRAPLLDLRFASQFAGDLLERTEETIARVVRSGAADA